MIYHHFRFGWLPWKKHNNFKVLLCRIFGHRINENPAHPWCGRCDLAYEECYYPKNYWTESTENTNLVISEEDALKLHNNLAKILTKKE
jgi:hypothetical protein